MFRRASRDHMIPIEMTGARTGAALAFTAVVMTVACATSSPPSPVAAWTDANPQTAHELANWARSHIRPMRLLTRWESREPDGFRDFVLWTVRSPMADLDTFLRAHAHARVVDDIVLDRRAGVESFMEWCRRHPAAAANLMSYPAPLEWIGDHLYRL